jgi:hypothetical protein
MFYLLLVVAVVVKDKTMVVEVARGEFYTPHQMHSLPQVLR